MTEEQKEILIAKMIDVPHSLSDEDLEAILTDDELREIYEVSSSVRGACIRQPEIDMPEEWKQFHRLMHRRPTGMRRAMHAAAIFFGILLVAGIIGKMTNHFSATELQPSDAKMAQTAYQKNTLTIIQRPQPSDFHEDSKANPIINETQTLVSSQHTAKTKTPKTKGRQEPVETNIDIDEYLRIQQARIDNDLAIQVAEASVEEYHRLLPLLNAAGIYKSDIESEIRKTTMQ